MPTKSSLCQYCKRNMVRIKNKPSVYECRNPKCTHKIPSVNTAYSPPKRKK